MNPLTSLLLWLVLELDQHDLKSIMIEHELAQVYVRINVHTKTITLASIHVYQKRRGTAAAIVDTMIRVARERGYRFAIELAHNPVMQDMARRRGMRRLSGYDPTYVLDELRIAS